MSIKTNFEFPRAMSEADTIKQAQRVAQDLSKNFKSIKKQLGVNSDAITPISLDGVYATQSFGAGSGSLFATFAVPHTLGAIPSSFIVSDFEISSGPITVISYSLFRLAWTTTDITVRLNITTSTGSAFAGSFKLLVLR